MSFNDDYEKAKEGIEFFFLLTIALLVILAIWPAMVSYYIGVELIDFPFGNIIIIAVDILLGIVFFLIGIGTEIKFIIFNGLVFLITAVVYIVSFANGFSSPAAVGNWGEFDEKIAEYHNVFKGEVTASLRREYFKDKYYPELRKKNNAERAEKKFQNSSDSKAGKKVLEKFLSELQSLDIQSAETCLVTAATKSESSLNTFLSYKVENHPRDEIIQYIAKGLAYIHKTHPDIVTPEEFLNKASNFTDSEIEEIAREMQDEMAGNYSKELKPVENLRQLIKSLDEYDLDHFPDDISRLNKQELYTIYVTDTEMVIRVGGTREPKQSRNVETDFLLQKISGKWYIASFPKELEKILEGNE